MAQNLMSYNNMMQSPCDAQLCNTDSVPVGMQQNAQLVKDMHVEGLSFYWRVPPAESGPAAGDAVGVWLDSVEDLDGLAQSTADAVLPGLDCDLRLMMLSGTHDNTCNLRLTPFTACKRA